MKDYYGTDLIEGWYWYTYSSEFDIFYPCFYNADTNQIMIDSDWYSLDELKGIWLFRANLPDLNQE